MPLKTGTVRLINGDCLEVLKTLPEASVDSMCTDPPAGIGFMGKGWDNPNTFPLRDRGPRLTGSGSNVTWDKSKKGRDAFIAFLSSAMSECLRILKPGAFGLVWALPRTSHWTATALEDVGFEIRDVLHHIFGTGFPKAKSCLKPAVENWILVRKPGKMQPLQIDECRISYRGEINPTIQRRQSPNLSETGTIDPNRWVDRRTVETYKRERPEERLGRWPANLCLSHHPDCEQVGMKKVKAAMNTCRGGNRTSGFAMGPQPAQHYADADGMETVEEWKCHPECPIFLLNQQSGVLKSGTGAVTKETQKGYAPNALGRDNHKEGEAHVEYGDSGGASRFFYCAKAFRHDRGEGNTHPTVKNTKLMEWLIKLVTIRGGVVLDPFMGSGSTLVAALRCGRGAIGIEREAEYYQIAQRRVKEG